MKYQNLLFSLLAILMIVTFFSLTGSFAQDTGDGNGNGNSNGNSNDNGNDDGSGNGNGNSIGRITICHATGSDSNPYNEITISVNGLNGHDGHDGDIIPAPEAGCPTETSNPENPSTPAQRCNPLVYDESFPNVDVNNCAPDISNLERPSWQAINLGESVCLENLIYHSNMTGDWELFLLDTVSGNAYLNLSRGIGTSDISPSRSPDGQWIAFMSNREGNWEIYISAVEGDFIQRLSYNTSAIERNPVWSPQSGQIVYESNRDGVWNLYLFDTSSGVEQALTSSAGNDVNAFWSEDGTKILFQSDREGLWQIYEKTLITNEVRRLSDGTANDLAPQSRYGGTDIVFRSFRNGNNSAIYWMNADGNNLQPVSNLAGYAVNQAVSPYGEFIAYTSNLDGDNDIYIFEFATGLTRQLTDNIVNDYAATWYCGSTIVSFDSDITGNPDLFSASVLPINAPAILVEEDARQLTTETSQELYPMMFPNQETSSGTSTVPVSLN